MDPPNPSLPKLGHITSPSGSKYHPPRLSGAIVTPRTSQSQPPRIAEEALRCWTWDISLLTPCFGRSPGRDTGDKPGARRSRSPPLRQGTAVPVRLVGSRSGAHAGQAESWRGNSPRVGRLAWSHLATTFSCSLLRSCSAVWYSASLCASLDAPQPILPLPVRARESAQSKAGEFEISREAMAAAARGDGSENRARWGQRLAEAAASPAYRSAGYLEAIALMSSSESLRGPPQERQFRTNSDLFPES